MREEQVEYNAEESGLELQDATTEHPTDKKPCPVCGERIEAVAKKCIHCDEFLEADTHVLWRWFGWTGLKGKTLWDFLSLLIVPIMLVLIGIMFTRYGKKWKRN